MTNSGLSHVSLFSSGMVVEFDIFVKSEDIKFLGSLLAIKFRSKPIYFESLVAYKFWFEVSLG